MPVIPIPPQGGGSGGAQDFIQLGDVPQSYSANADNLVRVKTDETGLIFNTPAQVFPVQTFTPILTSGGGTKPVFATNNGYYQVIGDMAYVYIVFSQVTVAGVGSNQLSLSLPVNRRVGINESFMPVGHHYRISTVKPLWAYNETGVVDKVKLYTNSATNNAWAMVNYNNADQSSITTDAFLSFQFFYPISVD